MCVWCELCAVQTICTKQGKEVREGSRQEKEQRVQSLKGQIGVNIWIMVDIWWMVHFTMKVYSIYFTMINCWGRCGFQTNWECIGQVDWGCNVLLEGSKFMLSANWGCDNVGKDLYILWEGGKVNQWCHVYE